MSATVYADAARWRKIAKLSMALIAAGVTAENVADFDEPEWWDIAAKAGVRTPSPETIRLTIELLVERERNTAAPESNKSHGG